MSKRKSTVSTDLTPEQKLLAKLDPARLAKRNAIEFDPRSLGLFLAGQGRQRRQDLTRRRARR